MVVTKPGQADAGKRHGPDSLSIIGNKRSMHRAIDDAAALSKGPNGSRPAEVLGVPGFAANFGTDIDRWPLTPEPAAPVRKEPKPTP
jgi:hypothetical protein